MRTLLFFLLCAAVAAGADGRVSIPLRQKVPLQIDASVRFHSPTQALRVRAGGRLVVTPDAANSAFSIQVLFREQQIASETEHLKPVAQKGWGAGVEEELQRLAASLPGWRDRWFPVRVEVSPREIWFWFDGRAITSLPRPADLTEIVFEGPDIHDVATTAATTTRGGFQPVALAGYTNAEAADGLPKGLTRVGGVPFEISSRAIDLSQAGLRLRKKPSGPGSLYQNPFNSISAMDGDPLSTLLRVPKRFYRRAWLLCGAANGKRSPHVSVRLARYRGEGGVFFSDATVKVPRMADTAAAPASVPFSKGRLWLVEVPIDSGAMQDILAANVLQRTGNPSTVLKQDAGVPWVEIELTRELRADLNCMLPLGPQSGVEVYGLTLEEAPVRMVTYSQATGNLFETGQPETFQVWMENITDRPQNAQLVTEGRTRTITLQPAEQRIEAVTLAPHKPGKYDLQFVLRDTAGRSMVTRRTTFGVLPPDTRKAERDSPFGLWSWGGRHETPPNEVEAELMRRAGARFTLGVNYPSKHHYGVGTGTDSVIGVFYTGTKVPPSSPGAAREMVETMKTRGSNPRYWQIYWEDSISSRHHKQYPPSMIGRPPMQLNAAEEERLKAYWDRAESYARLVRKELPKEKMALGAFANFTEEMLRRGFPGNLIDALSLEIVCFRMQPERPPSTENVHGLYFLQEWKKKYGYEGLDTILVESLFHGTAPGYLSERDQANYYVRDFLLGLAHGVKLFGMSAMITDVANDYYRSPWGSVGLCNRAPEPSPKESYVAFATMTRVLDQARYAGYVETGTPSVYALDFVDTAGQHIYPMWTTRGTRPVTVEFEGSSSVTRTNAMGVEEPQTTRQVVVSESPVYLKAASKMVRVRAGAATFPEAPARGSVMLDRLAGMEGWKPAQSRDAMIEDGNTSYPRQPGAFRFSSVHDAQRGTVVEVEARPLAGNPLLPMYAVLERSKPLRIAGQPRRLGVWVKGNSGWGRVTFDLLDAKGERWTGVGGSEDAYGHGFINFDGWRWVEVDLPGHFRADYPWPSYGNWTHTGGDAIVDYPLRLKAVIVEQRDQVVYVNSLVPVPGKTIRMQDVRAIY